MADDNPDDWFVDITPDVFGSFVDTPPTQNQAYYTPDSAPSSSSSVSGIGSFLGSLVSAFTGQPVTAATATPVTAAATISPLLIIGLLAVAYFVLKKKG